MMKRNIAAMIAAVGVVFAATRPAAADSLEQILKRGTLRWGGDQSGGGPYIFEGKDGRLTGFEVELAAYIAEKLGVAPEFKQWEWDKLPQLLDIGKIDIVMNGYEWTPEREQVWASTIPYYIYKLQLLARKDDESIRDWSDLKAAAGRPKRRVGVLSGSAAERFVRAEFGNDVVLKSYGDVTSEMGLVEQKQLDATVQDVPIAIHYNPSYPGLRPVSEPAAPGYYCMFVSKKDRDLLARLNEIILAALEDGTLRRIYDRYGIWNDDQDRVAMVAANWPPEITAPTSRWDGFSRSLGTLVAAAGMTLVLSCLSMPIAMLVGLLVAVGRLYGPCWLDRVLEGYVELLRGTPLLLQLFVIYYVLPNFGIPIPDLWPNREFWAGVVGLAVNYSAYEAENYRAGLLAIPRGQMEAALSLGMTTATALRRVIVPQAVKIVIPSVTNDFIALFKDTSVCSMIAVTELASRYRTLINDHPRLMLEFGLMTALLYMLMSYPLSLVARRLESKFKKAG